MYLDKTRHVVLFPSLLRCVVRRIPPNSCSNYPLAHYCWRASLTLLYVCVNSVPLYILVPVTRHDYSSILQRLKSTVGTPNAPCLGVRTMRRDVRVGWGSGNPCGFVHGVDVASCAHGVGYEQEPGDGGERARLGSVRAVLAHFLLDECHRVPSACVKN